MSVNEKPVAPPAAAAFSNVWEPDPWYEHSEEFYRKIYAGGKCKFCGLPILTDKDVCACPGMERAREEFKRKISNKPPLPAARPYNPDSHIEPQEPEAVF